MDENAFQRFHCQLLSLHTLEFTCAQQEQTYQAVFYFFPDNIARCVKDTQRKWVKSHPNDPNVWLVQRRTNLTASEIMTLKEVGFQL